ncbi:ankyrin repeat domain-containing protein 49-like isoform X3 [Zootermopsis nevadensis]|uniref:ankyrin repeat domain-containing protein 49-like isoform X3 n=1 Tax=Zootermopsis nevadensis TaxID=136037 RepID=UPI000B8E55CB|nr:ankyrin repeat domain-containing protein 49-like isoform X3 [Zootermopsis nevadensis]
MQIVTLHTYRIMKNEDFMVKTMHCNMGVNMPLQKSYFSSTYTVKDIFLCRFAPCSCWASSMFRSLIIDSSLRESPDKEILWASENGKLSAVERLILIDPMLIHVKDKDGYTPLHRACYNGHEHVVDLLLSHGANISAETVDGWQPLHSACKWNNAGCVAKLLEHGADPNAASNGDALAPSSFKQLRQRHSTSTVASPRYSNRLEE